MVVQTFDLGITPEEHESVVFSRFDSINNLENIGEASPFKNSKTFSPDRQDRQDLSRNVSNQIALIYNESRETLS